MFVGNGSRSTSNRVLTLSTSTAIGLAVPAPLLAAVRVNSTASPGMAELLSACFVSARFEPAWMVTVSMTAALTTVLSETASVISILICPGLAAPGTSATISKSRKPPAVSSTLPPGGMTGSPGSSMPLPLRSSTMVTLSRLKSLPPGLLLVSV